MQGTNSGTARGKRVLHCTWQLPSRSAALAMPPHATAAALTQQGSGGQLVGQAHHNQQHAAAGCVHSRQGGGRGLVGRVNQAQEANACKPPRAGHGR